jgi:hypothetical protein
VPDGGGRADHGDIVRAIRRSHATMNTPSSSLSPSQRAAGIQDVLRVWASALGCSTAQVTDVVSKSGLPMEKLWNSINAVLHSRRMN